MVDLHHGRTYKAYRSKRSALKRRTEREGLAAVTAPTMGAASPSTSASPTRTR